MITLLLQLLRLLPFLCGGHCQLALENLALHQQLAVYKRTAPRPKLRTTDRLFWVALARVWAGWRQPLVIVTPDTILRWQRRRFREHWTKLSGRPTRGRPPVNPEIAALVTRMTAANPLGRSENPWGAADARLPRGRAHRLPAHPEAPHPPLADLAHVPYQSRPGSGLPRFLHRCYRALARPVRLRRARSPPPARPQLQRYRASQRCLDGPADRGRLPRRFRPVLSPPRSRLHLRPRLPPTREGHGHQSSPDGAS